MGMGMGMGLEGRRGGGRLGSFDRSLTFSKQHNNPDESICQSDEGGKRTPSQARNKRPDQYPMSTESKMLFPMTFPKDQLATQSFRFSGFDVFWGVCRSFRMSYIV